MKKADIIRTMQRCFTDDELASGTMRIIGSAAMVMHGIIDLAADIDIIFLTSDMPYRFAHKHDTRVHCRLDGGHSVRYEKIDAGYSPEIMALYNLTPSGLFPECDILDGLPCDRLQDIFTFYRHAACYWGNPKYTQRFRTISVYLNSRAVHDQENHHA